MKVFERRGEQWSVQATGLYSGWNPVRHSVQFRRRGDEASAFVPGQVVFIGGGNLETVSEQDLCASLAEGLQKYGPTDDGAA